MTNRELARTFNMLGKVMELHGENPFKIRSYTSAYNTIRRYPDELVTMPREDLMEINGIGKNIADKIEELRDTGSMSTLQKYLDKTPPGIVELLSIKGLGAKKILTIWQDLQIESAGELLYACEENRLVDLKGFGEKTQSNLRAQLVYYLDAQGKYLFGHVVEEANELMDLLTEAFASARIDFINDIRRQMPIVESIDIIGTEEEGVVRQWISSLPGASFEEEDKGSDDGPKIKYKGTTVNYYHIDEESYNATLWEGSASEEWLEHWYDQYEADSINEEDDIVFDQHDCIYIPPESRDLPQGIDLAQSDALELIDNEDILGVVHCHSTYSDGTNTLADMAQAAIDQGYQYMVITDHSKSAFYAEGLKEHEVEVQMREIDQLNAGYEDFRIFKGIESDILGDGRLDYDDAVLAEFEVIIASVHANLKMDMVKATNRLINAIANPYTRILGHPTGRLLLSREGYPIDHKAIIHACAEHNVAIELNANPYRLDLDWTWIPYAVEQGVLISINPDAHNIKGISDIQYGVSAARKALLRPAECLNTLTLDDFVGWIEHK